MAKFRVIRILEYTYDDAREFTIDSANWNTPVNGTLKPNHKLTIRSATTPLEAFMEEGIEST